MTVEKLEEEIERRKLNTSFINIGDRGNFDECFNLLSRDDGKWEIFYGEHGQKTNPVVYDTEEEAAEAFLRDVCPRLGKRSSAEMARRVEKVSSAMSKFSFGYVLGCLIFCIIFGAFFTVVCFDPASWVFWFFVAWVVAFIVMTWRYVKQRKL